MIYGGWLLVILGVAQCFAGAGGVSRPAVRIGATLISAGLAVVIVCAALEWQS